MLYFIILGCIVLILSLKFYQNMIDDIREISKLVLEIKKLENDIVKLQKNIDKLKLNIMDVEV